MYRWLVNPLYGSSGYQALLTSLDHSTIYALTELVGNIIEDPRLDIIMVSPAYCQRVVCSKTLIQTNVSL